MKQLISNTAFGHYLRKLNYGNYIALRMNYDDFLSQILELWMFIPCELIDGIWTVLSDTYSVKPDRSDYFNDEGGNPELYQYNVHNYLKYHKAKERVLFEGWIFNYEFPGSITIKNKEDNFLGHWKRDLKFHTSSNGSPDRNAIETIEDLLSRICFDIFLTETAQKQIGL